MILIETQGAERLQVDIRLACHPGLSYTRQIYLFIDNCIVDEGALIFNRSGI